MIATEVKTATIYGLDSKGNVKIKIFRAEDDKFVTEYGRLGGKMTSSTKQCHNKNIGKKNESLAFDQALQMIDRGVKKDTEQNGYMIVPDEVISEGYDAISAYIESLLIDDSPMLAYPYKKGKSDWENGVMCSRKLDGIRCIAVFRDGKLELKSRKNKPITTMMHIERLLEPAMRNYCLMNGLNELRLDGELYNHEYHDNFEDLVSAEKKYQEGVSELLQYHVYGLIDLNLTAEQRDKVIYDIFENFDVRLPNYPIQHVTQMRISSEEEAWSYHKRWTAEGYEGAMLLNSKSKYRQGRSYELMKLKVFIDKEYKIIDVVPMEARPDFGLIILETEEGKKFKATPKCDEAKKAWYLQNKDQIIGKVGTVKYFSLTKAGVPRLPVFISVRDYE